MPARTRFQISRIHVSREVEIPSRPGHIGHPYQLSGHLTIPEGAHGLVVFAHGSGSSRLSPRNRDVARTLNLAGMGTLLMDLLTPLESNSRAKTFDIPLLGDRLVCATRWLQSWISQKQRDLENGPLRPFSDEESRPFGIGYFGASTGAAAAIWAAAQLRTEIAAVVSRGGRPDLVPDRLAENPVPTLLLVGGEDPEVLALNVRAQAVLADSQLIVIPGATHLFEEPGTLKAAALHAAGWFHRYFESLESARRMAG